LVENLQMKFVENVCLVNSFVGHSSDGLLCQGNPLLANAVMNMEPEIISMQVCISLPIYSIFCVDIVL
jgi:hypothetical protein